MGENREIWALLTISLIGLLQTFFFIGPNIIVTTNSIPVFLLFTSVCVLGAVATVLPHKCGHKGLPNTLDPVRYTDYMGVRFIHGHHKLCGGFKNHEIEFKGKSICAACLGLLIGVIIAWSISFHHFILGFNYPQTTGYLGLLFTFLGLVYIPLLKPENPLLRTLYNSLFVVGFALILVVVDNKGVSANDYLIIGLSLFWMYSRIQFSSWGHNQICNHCDNPCDNCD